MSEVSLYEADGLRYRLLCCTTVHATIAHRSGGIVTAAHVTIAHRSSGIVTAVYYVLLQCVWRTLSSSELCCVAHIHTP